MVDSSFEEVRRCPKCEHPGDPAGTQGQRDRSTLYFFTCKNPSCRWFGGAPWIRQRHPDGSWVTEQVHEKFFRDIPDRTDEVRASIDRDIARQLGQA